MLDLLYNKPQVDSDEIVTMLMALTSHNDFTGRGLTKDTVFKVLYGFSRRALDPHIDGTGVLDEDAEGEDDETYTRRLSISFLHSSVSRHILMLKYISDVYFLC